MCVLAGLLIGFEGQGKQNVSRPLRRKLEHATVKAANLALQQGEAGDELAGNSLGMMLSHVFDLLSDSEKRSLSSEQLLPILIHAPFFSQEGLQYGYFISAIDSDVLQREGMKFDWSSKSSTYIQCQRMSTGPLIASLGSLSRLMAYCVENVANTDLLSTMITDLSSFTRSLCVQWRQNKLSEIDVTEESIYLSEETLKGTVPVLWRVLRSTMFAIVIVLRSLLGRVLGDKRMPTDSGKLLAFVILLSIVDKIQLRSSHFRHSKYCGICTSSPRDWEQMPFRSTLLCFLPPSTLYLNSHYKPKPSFGKSGHHQQAAYRSTL